MKRPERLDPGASLDEVMSMVLFAAVVEAGSFTAAAARLDLAKSVVSARVARLEAQLGVKLLHRTTRRVALTPAGAALYPSCAEVARSAADVRARAVGDSASPRGRLRVNAPGSFSRRWLAGAIASFTDQYPEVHVELSLQDDFVDPTAWDAVIRMGKVTDLELVARKFASSAFVVVASPAYLARRGEPQHPLDLVGHACLHYAHVKREQEWTFQEGDEVFSVPTTGPVTCSDSGTLEALAEQGAGILAAPWFLVVDAVRQGRLVPVLGAYSTGAELSCQVVHAHGHRPPARVRAFVEHLVEVFREAPWGAVERDTRVSP